MSVSRIYESTVIAAIHQILTNNKYCRRRLLYTKEKSLNIGLRIIIAFRVLRNKIVKVRKVSKTVPNSKFHCTFFFPPPPVPTYLPR